MEQDSQIYVMKVTKTNFLFLSQHMRIAGLIPMEVKLQKTKF